MFVRLFVAFLLLGAEVAVGQTVAKPGAIPVSFDLNGNPIYKLIDLELVQRDHGLTPLVYQGTRSVEGEFKEVGFLGFCTATAVGPNIIYTAAHCISNGQRINWKMRGNGITYAGTCNKHPEYNDRSVFNDYAFCILDKDLPEDTKFASFKMDERPGAGWEALVNGFGAPNLGTHYWGKAVFNSMQGQDIVTCGPANLGGGDSGGSFLKWSINRIDAIEHWIFATNSRAGGGCSYFNWVGHVNFKPYGESQVQKGAKYVCGVTKDCTKPPSDPNKCLDEKSIVSFIEGLLGKAKARLSLCESNP